MSQPNDLEPTLEDIYLELATGVDPYPDAIKASDVPDTEPREELPPDSEMEKIFKDPKRDLAKYKIEIMFGSKRSFTQDIHLARIDLWMSGRALAGGGDDHMFICGYPDCAKPIPSESVGCPISGRILANMSPNEKWSAIQGHWAVCPHCASAGINNLGKQACSVEAVGYKLDKESTRMQLFTRNTTVTSPDGTIYPCIKDCILIQSGLQTISELLAKYWQWLDGNADFYMKYNPRSIQVQKHQGYFNQERPVWNQEDVLVIYPLANILKDTLAGSSLVNRIKAFLKA